MEGASVSEGDTVASQDGRARGGDTSASGPSSRWQHLLADAIRDPDELWRILRLPESTLPAARASAQLFPLLVPRGFVDLIEPAEPNDPLLRQIVPIVEEADARDGFVADPVRESACADTAGLLRKYPGRALLVTTGACAIHCRYCFRRHYPYQALPRGRAWWSDAIAACARDGSLRELILSGGDPLTLPDEQLSEIARAAGAVPHLQRLRIHSRLPVVLPERVDDRLLEWFTGARLSPVMVIHANHPRELSASVASACSRMRRAGITLLNQSVLLRGVNDSVDTLVALSERLFEIGVMPYYLHALDRVAGSAHFEVEDERAAGLMRSIAARLPGYLIPKWVREVPGEANKVGLPW
ncbi:MAG: EF-P beta-lysylation protein EpmB [Planctomycetes bacterium]|nr:EF-P beta-lysylation protein EpmB [Planctomycetota bacterium]